MDAASKLMEYMSSWNVLVLEEVYAGLITGHSKAGQLAQAEQVLEVMKSTQNSIGTNVYTSLLLAYAERGLLNKISEVM